MQLANLLKALAINYSLKEIGDKLNLSKSSVHTRLLYRGFKKIDLIKKKLIWHCKPCPVNWRLGHSFTDVKKDSLEILKTYYKII